MEDLMKKTTVFMMVVLLTTLASVAMAADKGENKVGTLFLFQKCDSELGGTTVGSITYDASGCPNIDFKGPWPILTENRRYGQMHYNLLGDTFRFSFQGKRLATGQDYTLIYYPDPWPGEGLICLGSGTANMAGNLQIHGEIEIPDGLPAIDDANYTPISPSGAVGAKIWLVLSADCNCGTSDAPETGLVGWNPEKYLFEGNLINYQYAALSEPLEADQDAEDEGNLEEQEPEEEIVPEGPNNQGKNGNAHGKNK
jgi:hypothetical protein